MPSWSNVYDEVSEIGGAHDVVRKRYLQKLFEVSGRNIITYYSGWLQKPGDGGMAVTDADKNGFMSVIHKMDRSLGLDLVLHTPGGDTAATESIVDYLRSMFGTDIRAIVPQLAMSAGTMISCSAKEIIMGKHSSLGPIDPQLGGMPAHGIVEEFNRAKDEVTANPGSIPIWQQIISRYNPSLIGECEKAIDWSNEMTEEWLRTGMFKDEADPGAKVTSIIDKLGNHALTKSHARHFSFDKCQAMGLNVKALEDNDALQDAVLSVHHSYILTFASTTATKIIENQSGSTFITASSNR